MTNNIKAVGFYQHLPISDAKSFEDIELPVPTVGGHDLLVRVDGVSVNPVDVGVRKGGRPHRIPSKNYWMGCGGDCD